MVSSLLERAHVLIKVGLLESASSLLRAHGLAEPRHFFELMANNKGGDRLAAAAMACLVRTDERARKYLTALCAKQLLLINTSQE